MGPTCLTWEFRFLTVRQMPTTLDAWPSCPDHFRRRPRGGAAHPLVRPPAPAKYADVGPRIVRAPMGEITFLGGKLTVKPGSEGNPTDWWYYEDSEAPAAAGGLGGGACPATR